MDITRELQFNDEMSGVSTLKLRDESAQTINRVKRIKMLRGALKKKAKFLPVMETAIPFNPFTGVPDKPGVLSETGEIVPAYNASTKYRPQKSLTTVNKFLKGKLNLKECAPAKSVFMSRAGVTEWDTSKPEEYNDADRKIFAPYRVPRIFTFHTVGIQLKSFTKSKNKFPVDYIVDVNLDPVTGDPVGEIPVPLQVSKLLNDICYAEYKVLKDSGIEGDALDKSREEIYKKKFIKDLKASNYIIGIELKLDSKLKLDPADVGALNNKSAIMSALSVAKVSRNNFGNGLGDIIDKYQSGELESLDVYDDFIEVDMSCANTEDPNRIGYGTGFSAPISKLSELPKTTLDDFKKALREAIDEGGDWEKIFVKSSPAKKYDGDLDEAFIDACAKHIDVNDKYLTDAVVVANQDILLRLFPDEMEERINNIMLGEEPEKIDEKESKRISKEFSDTLNQDDDDLDLDDVSLDE